jgi:hypothetical protein
MIGQPQVREIQKRHLARVLPAHGSRDQFGKIQKRHREQASLSARGSMGWFGVIEKRSANRPISGWARRRCRDDNPGWFVQPVSICVLCVHLPLICVEILLALPPIGDCRCVDVSPSICPGAKRQFAGNQSCLRRCGATLPTRITEDPGFYRRFALMPGALVEPGLAPAP